VSVTFHLVGLIVVRSDFQKLKVLFVVTCSEVELLAQRRRLCPVIPKGLNKLNNG
jgi:hypothetical protein